MLAEEDELMEVESAINLPDVEECIKILEEALADSLYEPFIMISKSCLLYTSPSPRDAHESRMPSSA